jgi:hypothetical protein
MENLDQILKHWESDSVIDQTEPGKELIRIPILHNKYLTILTKHKIASKKANYDYLRMKKTKWEYYTGKMSQEELEEHGWEPFRYTLKSDISTYLESDNDMIKLLEKKVYHDECVSVIEAIMSELKSRTFQLRDFCQWERFIGGQ